jgi:hypothetical protein
MAARVAMPWLNDLPAVCLQDCSSADSGIA